jgi:hypothetical protein
MFIMLFLGTCWGTTWDPMKWKLSKGTLMGTFWNFWWEQKADRKPQLWLEISFVLLIVQAHRWQHPSTQIVYTTSCVVLGSKLLPTFFVRNPIHEWTLVADCGSDDILRWFFLIGDKFHHLVVIRVSVLFRKSSGSLGRGIL